MACNWMLRLASMMKNFSVAAQLIFFGVIRRLVCWVFMDLTHTMVIWMGSISRVGVEAEYYWDRVTVKGVVGAEFIDVDNVIEVDEENLFAFSDVSYYAMDNLELSVGHRYTAETHALALGIEYQLDQQIFSSGVALFCRRSDWRE